MSYADELWGLLRPLGVYGDRGRYTGGELSGEGAALDSAAAVLEELEREAMPDSAVDWGLEKLESLLSHRPLARTPEDRQQALAALLRIGGDGFTAAALNDNLKGCGINVQVRETAEPGVVEVFFPDQPGIPPDYALLRQLAEEILPCHLQLNYVFWYVTWRLLEKKFPLWRGLAERRYTWDQLERMVK